MEYFLNDHKLHLNPISPLTDSQSMPKAELRKAPKEGFCSHCLLALGSHPTRRTVNGEDAADTPWHRRIFSNEHYAVQSAALLRHLQLC